MKKFIKSFVFALFVFTLSFSSFSVSTNALSTTPLVFSDVSVDYPYYDAVSYVKSQGIVNGYPDGTYLPDKTVSRAEFTKIIMEATLEKDFIDSCERVDDFADVLDSDWFVNYVCIASSNGIISGYSDTSFKPNDPVNFVEAAKIVVNGFYYSKIENDSQDWFKPFVVELENRNAIPTSVSSFDSQITRGELAQLIYLLKSGIDDQESNHFYSFEDGKYSKIDGAVQKSVMNVNVKTADPVEITLDNLDPEGAHMMFDFDTGTIGGDNVTPDFYLFEHFFSSDWMHSVDWNVVKMDKAFNEVSECPSTGYASVYDVNEEGFGTPYNPYSGDIYCLITSENKHVLLEIISAYNEGDDIFVKFKYLIQPYGGRKFNL